MLLLYVAPYLLPFHPKNKHFKVLLILLVYIILKSLKIYIISAPDGRVSNLQSSEVNYTSITVMWQPEACLQRNGLLIYYSVRYTESSVTSGPFNSSTLSFTATSLFPGTSYTFEIAAVNSEGAGPYTQVVVSTVIPTGIYFYMV